MTREEFSQFTKEFRVTFPNFAAWVNRLESSTGASPKDTFDSWFGDDDNPSAFQTLALIDCQRIIPLMRDEVDGYEPLAAFDYENFPRIIPRYVRRWKFENEREPEPIVNHRGAWQHVTAKDATMAEEFRYLLGAQNVIRKQRPGLTTAKEINQAAVELMGGILPDDRERALQLRADRGIEQVSRDEFKSNRKLSWIERYKA